MWWWAAVVVIVVGCVWAWSRFFLHGRLDRSAHGGRDDESARAAREAMREIDRGRSASRGQFPSW